MRLAAAPSSPRANALLGATSQAGTLLGAGAALGALRIVGRRSRGGSRGGEASNPSSAGVLMLPIEQPPPSAPQDLLSFPGCARPRFVFPPGAEVGDRWRINLLYDGDCPLCMMQVEFLTKRMDENPEYAGVVRLTNLADPSYNPEASGGVAFEDGMRRIHAITREGEVIVGVKVFQHIYRMVGMEWVYAMTSLPFIGPFFDWLYDVWAAHRLHLSGRTDVLERVHQHQQKIEELSEMDCDVECEIDWDE